MLSIDDHSNKIGEKTYPQLQKKKKKKREMFTHPLDPYNDVDVPVFPFSKLRPWWLGSS